MAQPAVILQVSVSPGGLPKHSVGSAKANRLGLEGDAHAHPQFHGGPQKAILLVTAEGIEELKSAGYPLFPGALGENLTVSGLDRRRLLPGVRLQAGQAVLQITTLRVPCRALDVYGPPIKAAVYDRRVKAGDPTSGNWGLGGFYASVEVEGVIAEGDPIAILTDDPAN